MNASVRIIGIAIVALALDARAAPPPPAIVALPRNVQNTSAAELAAGIALETAHWLSRSPHLRVHVPSDPAALARFRPVDLRDRLGVQYVLWIELTGSTEQAAVRYELLSTDERSRVSRRDAAKDLVDSPARMASTVLRELNGRQLERSNWVRADGVTYTQFVRALGRAHSASGDEAQRVTLLEAVMSGLEKYAPAVTALGGAYLDLAGRLDGTSLYYDRAENTLQRAFELDSSYPPARQKLASYYAKRGRSEESIRLLKAGLAMHPDFAGYHDQAGYVLRYAGLMDESMAAYRRSQALDPSLENLVASQDQITKSLIYLGQYQAGLSSHEKMESYLARLGEEPDEKEWFYRGVIYLYDGSRERALAAFQRGATLDSASVWTTFGRGYSGIARGERDQVAKVLAALERQIVVDGERHYRLVHFASFLGDTDRALRHLETAIRNGFFNAPYIGSDPLTAGLRDHPRFAAVLGEAQQRHSTFKALASADR